MNNKLKFWVLKDKVFWFLIISFFIFIGNQGMLMVYQFYKPLFVIYVNYISPTISTLSGGFFVGLLVYFFTVTMQERNQDVYILNYILNRYYEMKKDILSEILCIIQEKNINNESELLYDPMKAKAYFDEGEGQNRAYRRYKIWNSLSDGTYEDINIHLQNFLEVLKLFTNSKVAIKYNIVPMLNNYARSIRFDHHYVRKGAEMGGDQYKPFLRSIYFIFTGFDHIAGNTNTDYFANEINKILNKI